MQKQPPDPASPEFNKSAKLSGHEMIRQKIIELGSPLLERAYGRIEEKEAKEIEAEEKSLAEKRGDWIKAKRTEIFAELKDLKPEFKPDWALGKSDSELMVEANKKAEALHEAQRKSSIEKIKNEFLKEKNEFYASVSPPQKLRERFNHAAKDQSR